MIRKPAYIFVATLVLQPCFYTPLLAQLNATGGTDSTACILASSRTNCSGGDYSLTNIIVQPTNACLGSAFTASAGEAIRDGRSIVTSTYTNEYGKKMRAPRCPVLSTNPVSPSGVESWWVVSGVGVTPTNRGAGLSATFTPTNRGVGTIIFYSTWTDGCSTNIQPAVDGRSSFRVNQKKVRFEDGPVRPDTKLPWTWAAKLDVVCTGDTNVLATMNWGFSVDTNGTATLHKAGDGTNGDVGVIVVMSFEGNRGWGPAPDPVMMSGAWLQAYYVGCCENGSLNWIQTITTNTLPLPGEPPPPSNDHPAGSSGPFYYNPGGGPYGIDPRTTDYP